MGLDNVEVFDYLMKAAKLEAARNFTWVSLEFHEPIDVELVKNAASANGLSLMQITGKENHFLITFNPNQPIRWTRVTAPTVGRAWKAPVYMGSDGNEIVDFNAQIEIDWDEEV